jgi:hypothetical protein
MNGDYLIEFHYKLAIALGTATIILATCSLFSLAIGCFIAGFTNLAIAGMLLKQFQRSNNFRIY